MAFPRAITAHNRKLPSQKVLYLELATTKLASMIISTSKHLPKLSDFYQLLKGEFPTKRVQLVQGLGSTKTIVVRKSSFVGVQITAQDDQLRVDGTFPSIFTSIIATVALWSTGFSSPFDRSRMRFEREVSSLLSKKFG